MANMVISHLIPLNIPVAIWGHQQQEVSARQMIAGKYCFMKKVVSSFMAVELNKKSAR